MIRKIVLVAAGAIVGMITAVAGATLAAPPPLPAQMAARTVPCPADYASCQTGPIDVIDGSKTALNQFVVSDPSDAPQFSVGVGGAASWANPVCVTNDPLTSPPLRIVACIGGPWNNQQGRPLVTLFGAHGHAYTLTIGDIIWLHAQRKAGR